MENNIRKLRQERGWTQQELADRIEGKPHFATIHKLESNIRGLTTKWIEKIAKALGVPEEAITTPARSADQPRQVPLIGQIAAGAWREAIHAPVDFVWTTGGGPRVFGLLPVGDSMNRLIPEGAHVLVDPDDVELKDGKVYAVRNDAGEATIKRYRSDPPRLEPVSDNAEHQPIFFGREAFVIIGRVIAQGRNM
jgi:repressor LexA